MLWQNFIAHGSAWYPLLSACCHVEFDIFVICRVFMHCLAHFDCKICKSPWITFEETKHEIYSEHVAYLHFILWRRARLWLKLFANTVGTFLLRITSLSLFVFLRMVFPERSRTMAHTTCETVNGLARKQLYLNHVVPERPRGRNLYIEQEKHKLDQIVARNIRMFLDKP